MAKPKTFAYNPLLVTVMWRGIALTGFAEDSKVELAPKEDRINPVVGVDGDIVYNHNANRTATLKVTLMSSSPHCAMLRSDAENGVSGQLVINDANNDGGFIVACDDCMILGLPTIIALYLNIAHTHHA